MKYLVVFSIVSVFLCLSCKDDTVWSSELEFGLSSTAFINFEPIPYEYTQEGDNISPPLEWENIPDGTISLALICDDNNESGWKHWIIYSIPASTSSLPEDVPKIPEPGGGILQGLNQQGDYGYTGPLPPLEGIHFYYFTMCALDVDLDLAAGATPDELIAAIEGHIIDTAVLIGTNDICWSGHP